jgi:hypothetical protein
MQKIFWLFASLLIAGIPAREITEDFSSNPLGRGWQQFGANNLIAWNAENQNLDVTWDSAQPNHYFRLPLQTILKRNDDFSLSLDLILHDFAAGINPAKPATFQLAFGFQDFSDASSTNFQRAAANKAPNLVEFNFMPDTGFGPTIWPAIMSTNGAMNYSGASDFSIFNLPTGVPMRVTLSYAGTDETATLTITANNDLVGPITRARLATNDVAFGKKFTNFQIDAFSISSYSDAGYNGSLHAHGAIDNIVLNVPEPPIAGIAGKFVSNAWQVSFNSQTDWNYTLQRTGDFRNWQSIASETGSGGLVTLHDLNPIGASFYRVQADRID